MRRLLLIIAFYCVMLGAARAPAVYRGRIQEVGLAISYLVVNGENGDLSAIPWPGSQHTAGKKTGRARRWRNVVLETEGLCDSLA